MTELYFLSVQIFLLLAACFAASEAALFSLNTFQVSSLEEQYPKLGSLIQKLLKQPESLLSTLIIGNEVVSILLSTAIASLVLSYRGAHEDNTSTLGLSLLSTFISFGLLLTFSEVIPKVIAFRIPTVFAVLFTYPLFIFYQVLRPVRRFLSQVSSKVVELIGIEKGFEAAVSEKDFLTLIEAGAETGSVNREEKALIYNVFRFSDLMVSKLLVPWENVFQLKEAMSLSQAVSEIRGRRFSRIPVMSEDGREVMGVLYTKELLKLMVDANSVASQQRKISELVSRPFIVPSHQKVGRLFTELLRRKIHLAIVVDEYGRYQGIITLEDLLNALFKPQSSRGAQLS